MQAMTVDQNIPDKISDNVTVNKSGGSMRVRRVGSITAGVSLVIFGILYIVRMFTDVISVEMIFMLWPLIIIGLGAEILLSNVKFEELKYDKGAVLILTIMMIFASCMAALSEAFKYLDVNINI